MRTKNVTKPMKCTAVAATCILISLPDNLIVAQVQLEDKGLFDLLRCFTPCNNGYTGNEVVPGTGCEFFHECWEGEALTRKKCGPPLLFNQDRDYCDYPSAFTCYDDVSCPETYNPTGAGDVKKQPTKQPTERPTPQPTTAKPVATITKQPTPRPSSFTFVTLPPTERPTPMPIHITPDPTIEATSESTNGGSAILHIESKRDLIENYVLVSYNSGAPGLSYPSKGYTYDTFMQSLQIMGVDGFGADFKFLLWEGNGEKIHYGLVNLAAFLANCMVESIEDDTCDELNREQVSGRYAIANSCGQEKRSYQDESCDDDGDFLSCDVILEMEVTAVSAATDARAPPPLECQPKSGQGSHSGYWDASSGTLIANVPYSNDVGRTDTEGCCWWGRGALLTHGVCNIGKINHFLGKGGAGLGRSTLYPNVDFCKDPESTCASEYGEELRWTVAFFEWSERIQRYSSAGWIYEEKLEEFIDDGMVDDSFIDSVSRILSRGCHEFGCSDLEVHRLDKRRSNFYLIVNEIFDIKKLLDPPDSTQSPTKRPPAPWPTPAAVAMTRPTPAAVAMKQSTSRPTRDAIPTVAVIVSPPSGSPPQQVTVLTTETTTEIRSNDPKELGPSLNYPGAQSPETEDDSASSKHMALKHLTVTLGAYFLLLLL